MLDVACGTGFAARAAAVRVGSTGRVAGTDINAGMLKVAVERSACARTMIEWVQANADDLPFADASYDAVVSQQGLQFVPDLQAAVTEAARVTREGGQIAATVWSPMERSPYWDARYRGLREVLGTQVTGAAGTWLQADPVADAFRTAGLGEVGTREIVADVHLPSIAELVRGHLMATPSVPELAAARPDGVDVATASIVEYLAGWTDADGSVTVPFASMLIVGTR